MGACARRIVGAAQGTKASCLRAVRVTDTAWLRPSLSARGLRSDRLETQETRGRNRTSGSGVPFVFQRESIHPSGDTRRRFGMGIGVSLILIAAGAILTWAVNATVSGLDINTVGVILMIVGAIGLVLSLMFWSTWGGVAGTRPPTTTYRVDAPRVC